MAGMGEKGVNGRRRKNRNVAKGHFEALTTHGRESRRRKGPKGSWEQAKTKIAVGGGSKTVFGLGQVCDRWALWEEEQRKTGGNGG